MGDKPDYGIVLTSFRRRDEPVNVAVFVKLRALYPERAKLFCKLPPEREL